MSAVATVRPSRTARLMGPPPTGMRPVAAYAAVRRPACRMTENSGAWPSHDTTSADSAPITSSARCTMVSRTWLRSSDELSD